MRGVNLPVLMQKLQQSNKISADAGNAGVQTEKTAGAIFKLLQSIFSVNRESPLPSAAEEINPVLAELNGGAPPKNFAPVD